MTLDEFAKIMVQVSGKPEQDLAATLANEITGLIDSKGEVNNCTASLALIFVLELLKKDAEKFREKCEKARASAAEFMPN